jgi:hypothetical protein
MVRTGARAEALGAALDAAGFRLAAQPPRAPRPDVLPADLRAAVAALGWLLLESPSAPAATPRCRSPELALTRW